MSRTGFTLVEVLVALVIFAIGALGLAAETAALTRQLARGHRVAVVAEATTARLEGLQATACQVRSAGVETVRYHAVPLAELRWRWHDLGDSLYQLIVVTAPAGTLPGSFILPDTLQSRSWCRW